MAGLELPNMFPTPKSADGDAKHSASGLTPAVINLDHGYETYLKAVREKWPDMPDIPITFSDFDHQVHVPVVDNGFATIASAVIQKFQFRKQETRPFPILKGVTGFLPAGSMTLVLAPPGHGKTSFLKMVAGKLLPQKGSVKFAGRTLDQLKNENVFVSKLTHLVPQVDVHLSLLTVRETFEFCLENSVADPAILPVELHEVQRKKVDTIIKVLGLEECQHTILGNDLIRGVSGGQKKRVTVGEALLAEARVLCLDEATNGLDSAVAFDLFRALRMWTQVFGGTVVAALQQPTPELYQLFDQVMLLREGHLVYGGARDQVLPYFERLGVFCPHDRDYCDFLVDFLSEPVKYIQMQRFRLASYLSNADKPSKELLEAKQPVEYARTPGMDTTPMTDHKRATINEQLANTADEATLSTAGLHKTFLESDELAYTRKLIEESEAKSAKVSSLLTSDFARAQYGQRFVRSMNSITSSLLKRQFKYTSRNKGFFGPRVGQSIVMGLILGSVFYQLSPENFVSRIALIIFGLTFVAFANLAEIPVVFESRRVFSKQTDASLFPAFNYVLSVVIAHFPLAITETVFISTILYFMGGFSYQVDRFFVYLALMLVNNFALSVWFRTLASVAPNEELAQALAGPSTGVFLLFGGFFITRNKIPNFMIWLYYLSPFSWTTRAIAINEFHADRYSTILNVNGQLITQGDLYLSQFQMQTDDNYVWAAILMMLAYFVLFSLASALVLHFRKFELNRGTKRFDEPTVKEEPAEEGNETANSPANAPANVEVSATTLAKSIATSLPFTPVTLVFTDISFAIYVAPPAGRESEPAPSPLAEPSPSAEPLNANAAADSSTATVKRGKTKGKTPNRTLLHSVTGYAKPGTLTALMGASGAGKTTLMDVLAGRKTQGRIDGEMLVNGKPKQKRPFAKVSGYVEQFDFHISTDTVYETLLFSAKLRLPSEVSESQRVTFVNEVIRLLELEEVRNSLIGDDKLPGLSPGQLKRVTIGVELVANPSVLFLDEPTTGLDSKTARQVMRVIKRIAATGRSVICTVHQPSSEIFFQFDRLLLLGSGGYPVYFGPVGKRGRTLVQYFESIPGVSAKPQRQNPATWMLDVIGASVFSDSLNKDSEDADDIGGEVEDQARAKSPSVAKPNFNVLYLNSKLNKENDAEVAALTTVRVVVDKANSTPAPSPSPTSADQHDAADGEDPSFARNTLVQYIELQLRTARGHWRNVPYNMVRAFVLTILSFIFGLTFLNLQDDDAPGIQSKVGALFTTMGFFGIINSATSLPVVIQNRATYYREKAANTYSTLPYSLAIAIIEVPYIAFNAVLYTIPLYFMIGFKSDVNVFFQQYLVNICVGLTYSYMAQFLTSVLPNKIVAGIVQGMYFSLFFLFGGVPMQGPLFPKGWVWAHKIDPMSFALEAALMPQFDCSPAPTCSPIVAVVQGSSVVPVYRYDYVTATWGFTYGNYWGAIGYMVLFMTVIRLLTTLALKYIKHIQR